MQRVSMLYIIKLHMALHSQTAENQKKRGNIKTLREKKTLHTMEQH